MQQRARREFGLLEQHRLASILQGRSNTPEADGAEVHLTVEPVMDGRTIDASLVR